MKQISIRFSAVVSVLSALMSGCMSVSPSSVARLSAVDPLTLDLAAISVAVDLPSNLHLRTGDAILQLTVDGTLDETFVLSIDKEAPLPDSASGMGRHMIAAGIAVQDRGRFAATLKRARALRASRNGTKGSMAVSITGGCRVGKIGDTSLHADISIRFGESYVPLVRVDLQETIGLSNLRRLAECGQRSGLAPRLHRGTATATLDAPVSDGGRIAGPAPFAAEWFHPDAFRAVNKV